MDTKYQKLTPKLALQLANPPSWVAAEFPAAFGIVLSYATGHMLPIWKAVALFACCILMQSAVNTMNDYFDYKKGTDTLDDALEVEDAVFLYNHINPSHALVLAIAYLAGGAILGVAAAWGTGITPFACGIIGGLAVLFYSGGRTPISYLPIGEFVSGFVMGGLIPLAIVSIAAKKAQPVVLICSIPFIISIGLIMMTNNCCDIEKDIRAGRKTLPVALGREKARKVYKNLVLVWKYSIWVLPILIVGPYGIVAAILLHFAAKDQFNFLCNSPLTQENRINQMRGIIGANRKANTVYIAIIAVRAIEVLLYRFQ